jgi:hypothetical protein
MNRQITGIVNDYTISGDTRNGYTVYAEARTAVHQMRWFRVIVTRTLAEAKAKIGQNEANYRRTYGDEIQPRLPKTKHGRRI